MLKVISASVGLREELIASCCSLFRKKFEVGLKSLEGNAGLLPANWMVLWVVGTVFTAAMFLSNRVEAPLKNLFPDLGQRDYPSGFDASLQSCNTVVGSMLDVFEDLAMISV